MRRPHRRRGPARSRRHGRRDRPRGDRRPAGGGDAADDVFAALDLRRPGSTAIDVPALLRAVEPDTDAAAALRDALGRAVAGVLSAVVALTDPAVVLVGGSWGRHPRVLAALAREFADAPRDVPVRAAAVSHEPALAAARETALRQLRDAVIAAGRPRALADRSAPE